MTPSSTPSPPPQRIVSLETLPVDIARLITVHLPLLDLESLLRTSTAVVRIFSCNDLSFAIAHIRRHLPPPSKRLPPEHKCHEYCECIRDNCVALSGPDYAVLPTSYALFSFVGFWKTTFSVVFGDNICFHFYISYGYGVKKDPQCIYSGPKRDSRWIEGVLLELVRLRILTVAADGIELLLESAALLDSVELAAAVIEWNVTRR
ncbi:hypothetical protein HDU96_003154 [Phlyctochytrium bullatum]|nr:hypothetical protein HDU96_003154 [Phlyctochytrium bullatum]